MCMTILIVRVITTFLSVMVSGQVSDVSSGFEDEFILEVTEHKMIAKANSVGRVYFYVVCMRVWRYQGSRWEGRNATDLLNKTLHH